MRERRGEDQHGVRERGNGRYCDVRTHLKGDCSCNGVDLSQKALVPYVRLGDEADQRTDEVAWSAGYPSSTGWGSLGRGHYLRWGGSMDKG